MRLLLDNHISGRKVGAPLRTNGHDVRALDQEPDKAGLPDDELLRLASADVRILISLDVSTIPVFLRDFAERGEAHAGVILLAGVGSREFDLIVRIVETKLARYPEPSDWRNLALIGSAADL